MQLIFQGRFDFLVYSRKLWIPLRQVLGKDVRIELVGVISPGLISE